MPAEDLVTGNHRFSEFRLQLIDDAERTQIGTGDKDGIDEIRAAQFQCNLPDRLGADTSRLCIDGLIP